MTGFEPSGDDHAAAVIAALRHRHPGLRISAWGGPRMAAAGADIIEQTGKDAVMGLPGPAKIAEHQRINARVRDFLDANRVDLHIPVDSPAANFPICEMAKARGVKVVHLVAPQIWAWGRWRIGKLRRLTDFVCCLLPFEEPFFRQHHVPAAFVGHPLYDHPLDLAALSQHAAALGEGSPRLALMPGSRPAEIDKNFPILLDAFRRLKAEHAGLAGVVAAAAPEHEHTLRAIAAAPPLSPGLAAGWPESLRLVTRQTDAVIAWCDLALVVSGTVTLQVARQHKPMVVVYKSSRLLYNVLGRWLVRTPFFTLPNLVAGRRIVPELVPHFGGSSPLVTEAVALLENPAAAAAQRDELIKISAAFAHRNAAQSTADVVERVLGLAARAEPAA